MNEETDVFELESIVVDVPKRVMDFLRAHEKDLDKPVKKYLELSILQTVAGDLELGEVFDKPVRELIERITKEGEKA